MSTDKLVFRSDAREPRTLHADGKGGGFYSIFPVNLGFRTRYSSRISRGQGVPGEQFDTLDKAIAWCEDYNARLNVSPPR